LVSAGISSLLCEAYAQRTCSFSKKIRFLYPQILGFRIHKIQDFVSTKGSPSGCKTARQKKQKKKSAPVRKKCSLNQEKAALYNAPAAGPASARNAENKTRLT